MKKISFLIVIFFSLFFLVSTLFAGDVWVDPYYRSDGTYVRGHHRSTPDSNPWNNYSTRGNVNPYTGKPGYIDPYKSHTPDPYKYNNPYNSNPYMRNIWGND
jgi:hypothetical protein